MDASWLAKHTIFDGPWGGLLKSLGGIPIDRRSAHNVVAELLTSSTRRDQLVLAITPEGTRKKVTSWKQRLLAHRARRRSADRPGGPRLRAPRGGDRRHRATLLSRSRRMRRCSRRSSPASHRSARSFVSRGGSCKKKQEPELANHADSAKVFNASLFAGFQSARFAHSRDPRVNNVHQCPSSTVVRVTPLFRVAPEEAMVIPSHLEREVCNGLTAIPFTVGAWQVRANPLRLRSSP